MVTTEQLEAAVQWLQELEVEPGGCEHRAVALEVLTWEAKLSVVRDKRKARPRASSKRIACSECGTKKDIGIQINSGKCFCHECGKKLGIKWIQ